MTTTSDRFDRVRELFGEALEREPSTRPAFLESACGGDLTLQRQVEELLAAAEGPELFESAPIRSPTETFEDESLAMVGKRIGPYQIIRVVGFGGMGAVYESVRADDQFRKRVAIKLIKRGMDTDLAIQRFRFERQVLANLTHKNIAGLLDGGVAPDGRPYFVLEYVEGIPITRYCDSKGLSVRERLQLFRQVCSAVQYAHQNLVVHRDLKPGNVLVTADGTVKLLDFGIAKLLGGDDGPDAAPLTRGGLRALTPEYASPEMIRDEAITVSADIYSLGVVLFELLTGRRPFRINPPTLAELERAVCETPAPTPSSVVNEDSALATGERSVGTLRKRLTGEVDNIVLMALRKEAVRRYPSVEALAADIRRHLDGLPITAQRDWVGYRLGKFLRRNAALASVALLLFLSLLGGLILTTRSARVARREQRKAQQVTEFVTDMIYSADPQWKGRDLTVAQVLDQAAARVDSQLGSEPDVAATVRSTIGYSYLGLGQYEKAIGQFQLEVDLLTRTHGLESDGGAVAFSNMAVAAEGAGKVAEADSFITRARAIADRIGLNDTTYLTLLNNAARLKNKLGDSDSSRVLIERALAVNQTLRGPENINSVYMLTTLAVSYGNTQEWPKAEQYARQAVEMSTKVNGPEHVSTAGAMLTLAGTYDLEGKPKEAETAYIEALRLRRKALGADHPDYLWAAGAAGSFFADQRRCEDAIRLSNEVIAARGHALDDEFPGLAIAYQTVGRCLDLQGDLAGGGAALLESLELRRKSLPPGHWLIGSAMSTYGDHMTSMGKYPEAERLLLDAHRRLLESRGPKHDRTRDTVKRLIHLYERWNKPAEAAHYRRLLDG